MNYNKRTWLNKEGSDSTGSIVANDSIATSNDNKEYEFRFVEISDCRGKVRLHQTTDDTKEDFINKIKLLKNELSLFLEHLENN